MQIEESRKLLLSDTLVPDIFIMEHMPALGGLPVKLYLYALFCLRNRHALTEGDLARRMGEDTDTVRAALAELAAAGLIDLRDKGFEFVDIKSMEIEKIYRPRTASTPLEALFEQKVLPIREKLMADIAKTFFQGLMSPSWYSEIDSYFARFGFEPEVIYALFQECARRNKLNSKAYIAKVAENWAGRNIVTYADLNRYFMTYDRISKASKKIGRKLRRTMTEYDEEKVTRWIEKLGFEFELIEIALRKAARLANPSLDFVDRVLEEWFSHQLRDAESINAYEADKAARNSAERQTNRSPEKDGTSGRTGTRRNVGNFDQRQYSDEFLSGLYETLPENLPETLTENLLVTLPESSSENLPGTPPETEATVVPEENQNQMDLNEYLNQKEGTEP